VGISRSDTFVIVIHWKWGTGTSLILNLIVGQICEFMTQRNQVRKNSRFALFRTQPAFWPFKVNAKIRYDFEVPEDEIADHSSTACSQTGARLRAAQRSSSRSLLRAILPAQAHRKAHLTVIGGQSFKDYQRYVVDLDGSDVDVPAGIEVKQALACRRWAKRTTGTDQALPMGCVWLLRRVHVVPGLTLNLNGFLTLLLVLFLIGMSG
jgi:hypothetical protein